MALGCVKSKNFLCYRYELFLFERISIENIVIMYYLQILSNFLLFSKISRQLDILSTCITCFQFSFSGSQEKYWYYYIYQTFNSTYLTRYNFAHFRWIVDDVSYHTKIPTNFTNKNRVLKWRKKCNVGKLYCFSNVAKINDFWSMIYHINRATHLGLDKKILQKVFSSAFEIIVKLMLNFSNFWALCKKKIKFCRVALPMNASSFQVRRRLEDEFSLQISHIGWRGKRLRICFVIMLAMLTMSNSLKVIEQYVICTYF